MTKPMNFIEQLTAAEWGKTFTVAGAIERYKALCQMFANSRNMELSHICNAAEIVLHDKYGMDWDEIEAISIEAMKAA